MKKKLLSFIFGLLMLVPSLFLFTACGPTITGFEVYFGEEKITAQDSEVEIGLIEAEDWREQLLAKIVVKVTYADMTKEVLTGSEHTTYTVTGLPEVLEANVEGYQIAVKYANYPDITFKLIVNPSPNVQPNVNLVYNGQTQVGIDIPSGVEIVSGSVEGVNAGSYTAVLKPKANHTWGDGTTDEKTVTWEIAKCEVPFANVSKVYTGELQTSGLVETTTYEVTTDNGGTNVGEYDVVLSLKDTANYIWAGDTQTVETKTIKLIITKATTQISNLEIDGWAYSENVNLPTADTNFGELKYKYSVAEDGTYSETLDLTNAGTYYVKAFVEEGANYTAAESGAVAFQVAKKELKKPVLSSTDYDYVAGGYNILDLLEDNGFEFDDEIMSISVDTATNANDDCITTITLLDTNNYTWEDDTRAELTLVWSINKVAVSKPVLRQNLVYTGSEQVGIVWTPGAYVTVTGDPLSATNVGSYTATFTLNSNYKWNDNTINNITLTYTIAQATNVFTQELAIEDWTYGDEANLPTATAKFGEVTFKYATAEDGEYTVTESPTNAGTYYVKAFVEGTENYTALVSDAVEFQVVKATNTIYGTFTMNDWVYGEYPHGISGELTAKFPGEPIHMLYSKEENGEYETFEELGLVSGSYVCANVGHYFVKGVTLETDNYYGYETEPVRFSISQGTNNFTDDLEIGNWVYGETPSTPTITSRFGTPTYKYSNLEDGMYYSIIPEDVGTYYVKAYVQESLNYTSLESEPKSFQITKSTNTYTFLTQNPMEDWTYLEVPNIINVKFKNGDDTVKYLYSSSPSGVFTETAPVNVGTYYIKAVVEETNNYTGLETGVYEFQIKKAVNEFTSEFTVPTEWNYGEMYFDPPYISSMLGAPTYRYDTEIDGDYEITELPTQAGVYYVKAVVEGTDNYDKIESEIKEFEIYPTMVSEPYTYLDYYYFTGEEQTLRYDYYTSGYDEVLFEIVEGSTLKATEVGVYTATFALKDKTNYRWCESNTSEDYVITWEISNTQFDYTPIKLKEDLLVLDGDLSVSPEFDLSGLYQGKLPNGATLIPANEFTGATEVGYYNVEYKIVINPNVYTYEYNEEEINIGSFEFQVIEENPFEAIAIDGKNITLSDLYNKVDFEYGSVLTFTMKENYILDNVGEVYTSPVTIDSSFSWTVKKLVGLGEYEHILSPKDFNNSDNVKYNPITIEGLNETIYPGDVITFELNEGYSSEQFKILVNDFIVTDNSYTVQRTDAEVNIKVGLYSENGLEHQYDVYEATYDVTHAPFEAIYINGELYEGDVRDIKSLEFGTEIYFVVREAYKGYLTIEINNEYLVPDEDGNYTSHCDEGIEELYVSSGWNFHLTDDCFINSYEYFMRTFQPIKSIQISTGEDVELFENEEEFESLLNGTNLYPFGTEITINLKEFYENLGWEVRVNYDILNSFTIGVDNLTRYVKDYKQSSLTEYLITVVYPNSSFGEFYAFNYRLLNEINLFSSIVVNGVNITETEFSNIKTLEVGSRISIVPNPMFEDVLDIRAEAHGHYPAEDFEISNIVVNSDMRITCSIINESNSNNDYWIADFDAFTFPYVTVNGSKLNTKDLSEYEYYVPGNVYYELPYDETEVTIEFPIEYIHKHKGLRYSIYTQLDGEVEEGVLTTSHTFTVDPKNPYYYFSIETIEEVGEHLNIITHNITIAVAKFDGIETIEVLTVHEEGTETHTINPECLEHERTLMLDSQFITDINVNLKSALKIRNYTYKFFDEEDNEITTFVGEVRNVVYLKIFDFNDELYQTLELNFKYNFNSISRHFYNLGNVLILYVDPRNPQYPEIGEDDGYREIINPMEIVFNNGEEIPEEDMILDTTAQAKMVYEGNTYTYTIPIVINQSASMENIIESVTIYPRQVDDNMERDPIVIDGYDYEGYIYGSTNTYDIYKLPEESIDVRTCEGFSVVSKEINSCANGKLLALELNVSDGLRTFAIYTLISAYGELTDKTNIYASFRTASENFDYSDLFDDDEVSLHITEKTMLQLNATDYGQKITLYKGEELIEEEVGFIELELSEAGVYTIIVLASDMETTREITLTITGEAIPLLKVEYEGYVLKAEMSEYGIDGDFMLFTTADGIPESLIAFYGDILEEGTESVTISAKSIYSDNFYDERGEKIEDISSIDLKIFEDENGEIVFIQGARFARFTVKIEVMDMPLDIDVYIVFEEIPDFKAFDVTYEDQNFYLIFDSVTNEQITNCNATIIQDPTYEEDYTSSFFGFLGTAEDLGLTGTETHLTIDEITSDLYKNYLYHFDGTKITQNTNVSLEILTDETGEIVGIQGAKFVGFIIFVAEYQIPVYLVIDDKPEQDYLTFTFDDGTSKKLQLDYYDVFDNGDFEMDDYMNPVLKLTREQLGMEEEDTVATIGVEYSQVYNDLSYTIYNYGLCSSSVMYPQQTIPTNTSFEVRFEYNYFTEAMTATLIIFYEGENPSEEDLMQGNVKALQVYIVLVEDEA